MTPSVLDQDQASNPDFDGLMPQSPPNDFGVNNRNLPDQLKKALLAAIMEAQQEEKYVRRMEILQDAEHRFYDMGIQHCYLGRDNCYVQASPGGNYTGPNGTEAFGEYIEDYNIFTAYGEIIRAKLSDPAPPISFQPDDPNRTEDIEAASAAECARQEFDRNNNIKTIQQEIIYHLEMGGRVVMWTRTEDQAAPYGIGADGQPRRQSVASLYGCVEAKVPIFANKQSDFWYIILYDDPDIKTAKSKYHWISKRLAAGQVCLKENSYERIARLGVIQGSQGGQQGFRIGDSIAHLISRAHAFLRLDAFEECNDTYVDPDGGNEMVEDEETGVMRPLKVKEKLAQIYPDGAHVCAVGQEYAESWNECMDDCLSVAHAYIGKGQSRMPIMRPMVVIQDRFSSSMNRSAEEFDFNNSETWVSCGPMEFAAIKKQKSAPGMFRNLKDMPNGQKIQDAVYRLPGGELPSSFSQYIQFIQSLPQFQLAVPPSLWGSAMKDNSTASGYQLAASQAMGILGKLWNVEVWMLAMMYYHHCLAISRDEKYPDLVTLPGANGRSSTVRKESLSKGNFRAFPDLDSGFPESTNSKRQTLERVSAMIGNTPLGSQLYGSPDNIAFMLREEGLSELVIPEAVARNKQLREIEALLGQPPVVAQPIAALMAQGAGIPAILKAISALMAQAVAMAAEQLKEQTIQHAAETMASTAQGAPPPAAPPPRPPPDIGVFAHSSVPVWPSDYHVWEAKKCKDWLSSDDRNTEETIGRPSMDPADLGELKPNIPGILNIVLHMMEHDALAATEPMPMTGPLPAIGSAPKPTPPPPGM